MLRREVVKMAGSLFGLGAGTPSRFPYPDRPQPAPGLGPTGTPGRFRVVIVFGPAGSVSGVFVYKPGTTPGPGNTPIAAMTASGTDPFGNDVQPGDASALGTIIAIGATPSGGTPSYIQLVPGTPQALVEMGSGDVAETTPGEVLTQVTGAGVARRLSTTARAPRVSGENAAAFCSLVLSSPAADLSVGVNASIVASDNGTLVGALNVASTGISASNVPFTATAGTSANPSLITTDSWQAITNFLAGGWSATVGGTNRCRLMPDGMVYVQADVTAGTLAGGTNMFQLPSFAIYNPAFLTPFPGVGFTGGVPCVVTTSRVFQVGTGGFPAGTTRVVINGYYPSGAQLP